MQNLAINRDNHFFKYIKHLLLAVITCTIIGVFLMNAAFLLPLEKIEQNVQKSSVVLMEQTDYYSCSFSEAIVDNYTDALYLNEAIVDYRNYGLLITSLSGFTYNGSYGSKTEELSIAMNDNHGNLKTIPSEKRFWNGYILPLKITLLSLDITSLRKFNFLLHIAIIFTLFELMLKKGLMLYIPALALTYLFLDPITLGNCLAFSGFFYCTFIPCIFILLFNDKLIKKNLYSVFFCVIGCCSIFFNMNYFQLISLGIPLGFYYIVNKQNGLTNAIKDFLIFGAAWGFGYFGVMLAKWIVYSLFIDVSIFTEIYNNVLFRLSSSNFQDIAFTRFDAVIKNIKSAFIYAEKFWILQGVYTVILWCVLVYKGNLTNIQNIRMYGLITLLTLAIVLIRYFIFVNHVYIHAWVMYRLIAIPVFMFDIMLASGLQKAIDCNE